MSPRSGPGGPHSPLYSSSNLSNSSQGADMQKLREEFQHYKTRQEHWEQAYSQAKSVSISLSLLSKSDSYCTCTIKKKNGWELCTYVSIINK